MSLQGFPNLIKVVLGDAFSPGKNSLDPAEGLVLQKVSGEDKWTEDGTDTPNETTNRLRLRPTSAPGISPTYGGNRSAQVDAADNASAAFYDLGRRSTFWSGATYQIDYTFLDVWNANTPIASGVGSYDGWGNGVARGFLRSGYTSDVYNPQIFSTLEEAVGDLNVLDGATPIPDGGGPVDFGTATEGDPPVTKTFTVENLGDLDVTINTVSLPTGYSFGAGNEVTDATLIPAGQSKDLVVDLDTATTGTKNGSISLANDGPAGEDPYNWSVTGEVVAEGAGQGNASTTHAG